MKLLSVNVSPLRVLIDGGREIPTGILKEPVPGPVRVRRLGLDGDVQADRAVHGGLDKAVYAYPSEHYAYWEAELSIQGLPFGQFGENLTLEGLLEDSICIGDVVRIGEVVLQVSSPREPCFKLALKFGRVDLPKAFLASGRVGFYLRVLEEGSIAAGDPVDWVETDPMRVSVREMSRLLNFGQDDLEGTRRALEISSLSARLRHKLSQRLAGAS